MERASINSARPSITRRIQVPAWIQTLHGSMTNLERAVTIALFAFLLISGVFSIINFVNNNTTLTPREGGVYREAAVGQPRHINPILAGANDLDVDITRLIYSGLLRFNGSLELENNLASEIQISDDAKEYTVTLRRDVLWHDGEQFNAEDVVFTIRSIQTPNYGSPLATAFQGVTVEMIDEFTVSFKLTQPYTPFLTSLTVGIVPEHVWSQIEPQNATLAEQILKPVGTGPFQFVEITTRRKTGDITNFRMARNEKYYGPRPYLDEIILSFFSSHEEALQALLAGKVDGIGFLPLEDRDQIQKRGNLEIHRLLLPQYFAIFFNEQNNEALTEAGVRSALNLGTDRNQIVAIALAGQGEPLHLPIPPGTLIETNDFDGPKYDVKAAIQNLEESGWKEGADGIREKDGKRLSINLVTTDWPEYITTAEIIQQQWRQLGVDVTLEHLGAGTIQQTVVQPRDYEALLFGEILPADPDPYPFWHSTQTRSPGLNLAMFQNSEVDKLLEEARKEGDRAKRGELYRDFQNKILEHTPAIILYRPFYLFATANLRGVNSNHAATPAGRFNNIEQWHLNTRRIWNN